MRVLFIAVGLIVAVVGIVAFTTIGRTSAPFDRSGEAAVGMVENGLGDRYTLDASSLSSTWTFTRDADIVLRFEDGSLALDGQALESGCYSGHIAKGAVLAISDGRKISFASPDSDSACRALP